MKKILTLLLVLISIVSLAFAEGAKESGDENIVNVYAYDSFAGDWGPGAEVIPAFEEKTGIKVNLVSAGDAGEMLSRIIMEGDNCEADVVLGITDDMAYKAYEADILSPYESPVLETMADHLIFDPEHRLLPFDYGVFSFVYDTESDIPTPTSLEDLTNEIYKDQVILIDPRTSSVGLGLLMWTYNVLGEDNYLSWWSAMRDNMLTMADGWSSAYGLFTEGEAPLVISYTTSPVYHVLNEDTTRYQAVIFDEGHQETIEGIGILKNAKHRENAETFVDFILTEGQEDIAVLNSMYPVNSTISLPDAYEWAPEPEILFTSDSDVVENHLEDILSDWIEVMTN